MIEIVSQRLIELIADLVCAVLAHVRCVVDDIAGATAGEEGIHVLTARLAGGRSEGVELRGRADNRAVVQLGHHLCFCQSLVGEGSEDDLPCLQ